MISIAKQKFYIEVYYKMNRLKSFSSTANSILLLDDEADITIVLKQSLEKQGFHVIGFTDPLLALGHFQRNHKQYALVISDLRMPAMNGYEFVKQIKRTKPDVKVFLMTAFEIDDVEFHSLLQSVKIDEFIQKPIPFKGLARIINKHVQKKPGYEYQQSYVKH
jgi:DNA-binding NtrC family response regulator